MSETINEMSGENKAGKQFRSGFATIIGLPNVGKSTIMNRLIGQKIAITSYKPQTTRNQIRTVYTDETGQIVFMDTPGIHRASNRLGEYMLKASAGSLKEVDVILWLVEPKLPKAEEYEQVLDVLGKVRVPIILVVNKTDTVKKEALLPVISEYSEMGKTFGGFAEIMPVSAMKGDGIDELKACIFRYLPYGEPYYDEDTVTTETEREIAAEIVREKALRLLQDEVPHGIAVVIDRMKERNGRDGGVITDIDATIICEKESHKGIIIGKGGSMLRSIGTAARTDMENMLQGKVNLKLWVKVRADWKDSDARMKEFGYDIKSL